MYIPGNDLFLLYKERGIISFRICLEATIVYKQVSLSVYKRSLDE